jgi:CHAT domain-containing protein
VGLSALLADSEISDDPRIGTSRRRDETDARLEHLRRTLIPDSVWRSVREAKLAIIAPDASLHLLPFDALVIRRGRKDAVFWIDEGPPIIYASTATSMIRLASRGATQPPPFRSEVVVLSVADPSFAPGDGATRGLAVADAPPAPAERLAVARDAGGGRQPVRSPRSSATSSALRQLRIPLPGSRVEARAIRHAFAPESVLILEGRAATERGVRAALTGETFLHFGTHGFVTHRRGEVLAGLALAESDSSLFVSSDDGLLQLYEIYELPVACELAVLSAAG